MEEKIMTLHPAGKSGVNIGREKYDVMRDAILESVRVHDGITCKNPIEDVRQKLEGSFEGSISWYVTTVKLDLEARGLIERIPDRNPQRLRLTGP
jgi:hypothetical protein